MKKLFALLSLIVLASCGEKGNSKKTESGNILENLTYSVDTVVVDPGDELLSIESSSQLQGSSSLSQDQKLFYLFNNKDHSLAVVDLDQLKLLKVLPFEIEGPNGVGKYAQGLQVLVDGNFLITTMQSSGIFNREGKKLKNYPLNESEFKGLKISSPFSSQLLMTSDGKWLFSLTGFYDQGAKDLVKLDPIQKTGEAIDLPALDMADEFGISLLSNEGSMIYIDQSTIDDINGKLYISNKVTSSIYSYDYQIDSLQLITFQHRLVANEKTGSVKNEVSSKDELFEEMEKVTTQIGFEKLLWDKNRALFFRLGTKLIPSSKDENNTYKFKVYLFAYDADLKLLGEKLLEDLTKSPKFYFFKDGKLWSYVNVDDELGFAVFNFDF
jgi:hypothetical protein